MGIALRRRSAMGLVLLMLLTVAAVVAAPPAMAGFQGCWEWDGDNESISREVFEDCQADLVVNCNTVTAITNDPEIIVYVDGHKLVNGQSANLPAGSYEWDAYLDGEYYVDAGEVTTRDCDDPGVQSVTVTFEAMCDGTGAGLLVTVDPEGAATWTAAGVTFTGDKLISGLTQNTSYLYTVTPAAGFAFSGLTSDSVSTPVCAEVAGVVVEATTTTIAAVAGDTLPFTGSDTTVPLALGVGALLFGGLILVVDRRRQAVDH